jgi:hypothetical protein
MVTPLSVCTKKEQRSVIRFLWSEGVSGAEIRRRLSTQYGKSVLPQVRTSVTHEEAGRPSMATTDDNIDRVCDMVLLDR